MTAELPLWLEPQRQRFVALRVQDRLPHALLLTGPPGIGKLQLADLMAQSLLCDTASPPQPPCGQCRGCVQHQAGSHPDCAVLSPDPQNRSAFSGYPPQPSQAEAARRRKAPQRRIEIGQVRDLAQRLTASAHYGGYRLAVLTAADRLRYEAANALLKILEEPGDDVLFVLVADAPGRLPATIRSRCQWLRCSGPDRAAALEWLDTAAAGDVAAAQRALLLAQGSPRAARELLVQGEEEAILPRLVGLLAKGGDVEPLADAAALDRIDSESLLRGLVTLLSVAVRLAVSGSDPQADPTILRLRDRVERVDLRAVLALSDWVVDLRRHDAVAMNSRLLLEQFLVRWKNLPKAANNRPV